MYQIAHIGIKVKDVARSMKFYQEVLGCEEKERHENERVKIIFAMSGNDILEFIQDKTKENNLPEGVVNHIAFHVADIEKEINRLRELGVKCISDEPREFNGGKIFFFSGPDGEILEFVG
ncbi:VOC family protein [Desulforamulus aquiferis]|uniref:VOC family protein n=1 Tax=Desulforamulus aquiferis TaxID=1397668 RepID=A0AAW7ZDE8_9FIRM|nr:VOC family protein [Desulforamulus aquiferis]MDO7787357.1 VOC family protein [Desulforamulus aquiferis]